MVKPDIKIPEQICELFYRRVTYILIANDANVVAGRCNLSEQNGMYCAPQQSCTFPVSFGGFI